MLVGSRHSKKTKQTKGKILHFVTTYDPGVKNLKQILMQKSRPKSATVENNLYNASYYIIQKKENHTKICSSEQNFSGSCAATAKPHRGVCVGLNMTLTNYASQCVILANHNGLQARNPLSHYKANRCVV